MTINPRLDTSSETFHEWGHERGLVTPDRTTLIASNHRTFAIGEKIAPGNGIADQGAVIGAIVLLVIYGAIKRG